MIEVKLPSTGEHRLPYYLSLEEWVACNLPDDDYIFSWRVAPTVICGRNQDIPLEVNFAYCRDNGIDVVRRRSGGGCVYADMNNYMFSFITPGIDVEANFSRYSMLTAEMLRSLGFDAQVSGRNDILIGGSKIAGNAFYLLNGHSIAHGTMLFDVDAERMTNAITPSRAKLESKSVVSVPHRVTCLRSLGLKMDVVQFGRYAIDYFTHGQSITLTPAQIAELDDIEKRYYNADFLFGRSRKDNGNVLYRNRRIEGVGEFFAEIGLKNAQTIEYVHLNGDFFPTGDIAAHIEEPLRGCDYELDALLKRISGLDTASVIKGLAPEALLEILI